MGGVSVPVSSLCADPVVSHQNRIQPRSTHHVGDRKQSDVTTNVACLAVSAPVLRLFPRLILSYDNSHLFCLSPRAPPSPPEGNAPKSETVGVPMSVLSGRGVQTLKSEGVYVPACAFLNVCAALLPTFCRRHGQETVTPRSEIAARDRSKYRRRSARPVLDASHI